MTTQEPDFRLPAGCWPFGATNEPASCLWCGAKLNRRGNGDGCGYRGNGAFCSLRCGMAFGVNFANLGHRLKPKPETHPPRRETRNPADRPSCQLCKKRMHRGDLMSMGYPDERQTFYCERHGYPYVYASRYRDGRLEYDGLPEEAAK